MLKTLPGGSRSVQVIASDGNIYAVKRPRNPQTSACLAAEMIATTLMAKVGAPVARHSFIDIDHPDGPSLAIAYPVDPRRSIIHDLIAPEYACLVGNLEALAGVFILDRWLANADVRQTVCFNSRSLIPGQTRNVTGSSSRSNLRVIMIDQGCCFSCPDWSFKVGPRQGQLLEASWMGLQDREEIMMDYISRIRRLPMEAVSETVRSAPKEWLPDRLDLDRFLSILDRRRNVLPDLVDQAASAQFGARWNDRTLSIVQCENSRSLSRSSFRT